MRLLIVEDEPDLLAGLTHALRNGGYAVDTATDGEEGLFKAMNTGYDAIILDVMLPRMDGWTVLEKLRKTCSVPVLILTARDAHADRVRGLDTGADDYLVKPFDNAELFARLRALIRRTHANQSSPDIIIDDITIRTTSRSVTRSMQPVALTAREYAILEYLAFRRGSVVSRTDLYEHLFDENDDTLSNLLDVHIHNLRKKLGEGIILTRRGQGYIIP